MQRYLLCRPVGGLNDLLCQIEKCCRYAEEFDRTVVVDTNFPNAKYFRDRFARYFDSRQRRLILSTEGLEDVLANDDIHPQEVRGRLDTYRAVYHWQSVRYLDEETQAYLSFDFARDYPHRVLLHHQLGGGILSATCLLRMTLVPALAEELRRRWQALGPDYAAIHIRHTDYQSDYRPLIPIVAAAGHERLFVATDNRSVLDEFAAVLGRERVHSFAELDFEPGKPLHSLPLDPAQAYVRNRDAILDLLLLALAKRLYLTKLTNARFATYSGFSDLARALSECRMILRNLIPDRQIAIGLE